MRRGVLCALGAAGALLVLPVAHPALADEDSQVDVEEMLPALDEAQTADDRLPDAIDLDEFRGVRPETVRSLGSDGTAQYWVARAGSSDVCLILHIPGGIELSASTCGPITAFYRTGLALAAGESPDRPQRSVQAYLLPSDVDISKLARQLPSTPASAYNAQANMLSLQWHDGPRLPSVDLRRSNGEVFWLAPLER